MNKLKRKGPPIGAAPTRLEDLFIPEQEWQQELNIFEYQGDDLLQQKLDDLHQAFVELGHTLATEFRLYQLVDGLASGLNNISNAINDFNRIGRKWIDG